MLGFVLLATQVPQPQKVTYFVQNAPSQARCVLKNPRVVGVDEYVYIVQNVGCKRKALLHNRRCVVRQVRLLREIVEEDDVLAVIGIPSVGACRAVDEGEVDRCDIIPRIKSVVNRLLGFRGTVVPRREITCVDVIRNPILRRVVRPPSPEPVVPDVDRVRRFRPS